MQPARCRPTRPGRALRPAVAVLAVGLMALVTAAACSGADADPPATEGDPTEPLLEPDTEREADEGPSTLRWAIGEPDAIVPPLARDPDGHRVVDALFDGLIALDDEGRPEPLVADSWRSDEQALAWTFFLDRNARFHDGTPVTSEDVRTSWQAGIRDGEQPPHLGDVIGYDEFARGETDSLEGLSTPNRWTVQVLLDRPRADFPALLAHPALAPVPADRWEHEPEAFARDPLGNGAFELAEPWSPGEFLRLRAADAALLGDGPTELVFRVTDPVTGYVAFQQGRVDVATVPRSALGDALDVFGELSPNGSGSGVTRTAGLEVYALGMNVMTEPFDDVRARRALSFAVDRERIAEIGFEGHADLARGVASREIPTAQSSACPSCVHAPESAERLFDQADLEDLTLWIDRDGGHEPIAEQLADDLAAVGVNLEVRTLEFPDFLTAIEDGTATLFRSGWQAEHPLLSDALIPMLHSRNADGAVATGNPGRYRDEEIDELLDDAMAALDPEERAELFGRAERLALGRDMAFVPLVAPLQRLVVGERVAGGFDPGPDGRVDLRELSLQP
ncbi:ABC transporter substrate-binding protein [Egibacter rhizosphaerae]|uniref:ABC transporter substrate-binding protein n=1 Tax=Egibacter rhizosphaerae TaxID=1670831 RepID=A0A411YKN6_9ACTN|nr:ABC transporter substrate-binding protein [Egibacter rhizosphaerae]QBI21755.1 ABC transporter substrate-binding protein [Egibacter rhizosphaerae]